MSHVVMGRLLAWTCVIAGAATLFGLGLYLYSGSGWERAANISTVVDMFAGLVALGLGIYGLISGPHAAQTSPESGRGGTATGSPNEIRDESARMLVGEALAPPTSLAPARLRGRKGLLRQLRREVRRPGGRVQVLSGLGGVGKSATALQLCRWVKWHTMRSVWWISASDAERLIGGLVSLARALHANYGDLEALRSGSGAARDLLWQLLEQKRRGWMLVFDNADDPRLLGPLDGTGWLRGSKRGMVLVTSRLSKSQWGSDATVHEVTTLTEQDAARLLLDLAPHAGDETDARALAGRLGCLPLALGSAGRYLQSRFATAATSFTAYQEALDTIGIDRLLTVRDAIGSDRDSRGAVMRTWELSLESLAAHGLPQARPLLRLLSCYAAPTPIPVNLLRGSPVDDLIGDRSGDEANRQQWVDEALGGLAQLWLVTVPQQPRGKSIEPDLVVHPLVAETSRVHLNNVEQAEASEPDPGTVRRTAVKLVATAVGPLRFDNSQDWPTFRVLAPHMSALLDSTSPYLDRDCLAQLLTITAKTVAAYAWGGAASDGEDLANRALARGKRLERDHPANLDLRNELAWAVGKNGDWRKAQDILEHVLAGRKQRLGAEHADTLDTRHKLAWAVGSLGDWREAEAQFRDVHAARTALLGDEDLDTLHTRCCLLWAVSQNAGVDEAQDAYLALFDIRERLLGPDHPETWDTLDSLAEAFVIHGRYGDAEVLLRKIIKARPRVRGSNYPQTLDNRPRYWLACALRELGHSWRARREFRRLYADQVRTLGPNHPATQATCQELTRTRG